MLRRRSNRILVKIGVGTIAVALAVGFALDWKGFAGNLLAEVVGMLGSVLLAVLVIDALVERDRAQRWALVADETLEALRFALERATMPFFLRLPLPRPAMANPASMALAGAPGLASALSELAQRYGSNDSLLTDPAQLDEVRPQLAVLRDGVMPRLLAMDRSHSLIAALARVERTFQELEHAVWQEARLGTERQVRASAVRLLEAMQNLAERSAPRPGPDNPTSA